jgi:ABC-type lipoprotein release transport system permease subunit
MAALALLLRRQARGRWRSWVGAAVLVGVISGAIIATLAGARRTETAYARFIEGTHAFDVIVSNGTSPENINRQFDFDEVAHLPDVVDAAVVSYYFVTGTTASGRSITTNDISPLASLDGRFGSELNAMHVLEGRLPARGREVALSLLAADRLDVHVGATLQLQLSGAFPETGDGPVATEDFRVVGVVALQSGFPPMGGGLPPPMILSGEYARAHRDAAQIFVLRLRPGTDFAAFDRVLSELAGNEPIVSGNRFDFQGFERSSSVEATALRLFAALMGLATVVVLGQALLRQSLTRSAEDHTLRALGVTSGQVRIIGLARGVLIAGASAVIAPAVAVALSPLTPVGVARQAELRPGIEVNGAYLGIGALAVFVTVAGMSWVFAWVSTRRVTRPPGLEGRADETSRLGDLLARAGGPASATTGVRMALEPGPGQTSVPVRSTIVSAAVVVAMVTGLLGFSASLRELFDAPELYGWTWDVQIGDNFGFPLTEESDRLLREPAVDGLALGAIARLSVDGTPLDALAVDAQKGTVEPTVVEGRGPRAPGEVFLGTRTLRDLGVHVGVSVIVEVGDRSASLEVVGRGVLTEFGGAARLGEGAMLTFSDLRRLQPEAVPNVILLRAHPGPDGDDLVADVVRDQVGTIYLPAKPSDLADLEQTRGLLSVLAAVLGTTAMATLAHTLTSSVRRRRRDLATLKVLGFVRSQVSAAVVWQSSVIGVLAVAVGLPLGAAVDGVAWDAFADRLGVPPRAVIPVVGMGVVAAAVVVMATLIAVLPARWAARTSASAALRAND